MGSGRVRAPYRQRVLYYCERNGITVPRDFDVTKSTDRLAVIDVTEPPHRLLPRTTFMEKEVIRFLQRPENAGRHFRLLDFKRGVELRYLGGNQLAKGEAFEFKAPGEVVTLVER